MKNPFKIYFYWLLFGLGFITILGISYLAIKARSTTKTTTDAEPNKLYVGAGETLTAAKRNTVVSKFGGINMKVYTWTTSNSSPTSFSHWLDRSKIMWINCMIKRSWSNFLTMWYVFRYETTNNNRLIEITSSDINIYYSNETTSYWWQEYRCIIFYTD